MKNATTYWLAVVIMWAGWGTLGCAPPQYTDFDAFMTKPRPIVGGKPYIVEPPDTIRISAPNAPEIHNFQGTIRPDGYITLDLIGDVFAAGKTPSQLGSEVEERILQYYEDVTVQVIMVNFASKKYYMAGEGAPGPRQYTGTDTVLDAVISAASNPSAWPEKVVVIRPNEEGELVKRMTINVNEMIQMGNLRYNAVIEEGDIIFIPTHPLAQVGRAVQRLLQPVSPALTAIRTPGDISANLENFGDDPRGLRR